MCWVLEGETAAELEEHAFADASAGNRRQALAVLTRLRGLATTQEVNRYFEALIYTGIGDTEQALSCREKASLEHCDWLIHADAEPRWPVRNCAAFRRVLAAVGLCVAKPLQAIDFIGRGGAI
jgi:hypothetical protein